MKRISYIFHSFFLLFFLVSCGGDTPEKETNLKFIGLDKVKGKIEIGFDADLLVFDEQADFTISNEMIKHRHKITPYVGRKVKGKIMKTYLRGELVYCDDKFLSSPKGRPILRKIS